MGQQPFLGGLQTFQPPFFGNSQSLSRFGTVSFAPAPLANSFSSPAQLASSPNPISTSRPLLGAFSFARPAPAANSFANPAQLTNPAPVIFSSQNRPSNPGPFNSSQNRVKVDTQI